MEMLIRPLVFDLELWNCFSPPPQEKSCCLLWATMAEL